LICEVTELNDYLAYEAAVDGEVESFRNREMGARKTMLDTEADDERDYEESMALDEQSWINGEASAEDAAEEGVVDIAASTAGGGRER
jgi:hypothetical protein